MEKILIFDGLNFIWRAAASSFDQSNDDVIIYNFFRSFRSIIEQFKPDRLFFVLEGRPEFRYALYSEYKANRIKIASKEEDTIKVFKAKGKIVNLLKYLPVSICYAEKYECDDVINTLCNEFYNNDITIISNDSDYIQLLQRNFKKINIYDPIKKKYMDSIKYPYVVFKSLVGDKADNIPGILSFKEAIKILNNPNLFKSFLSKEENRSRFNINKQLIEFRNVSLDELIMMEGNAEYDLLQDAFLDMKFVSITNKWCDFVETFDCLLGV